MGDVFMQCGWDKQYFVAGQMVGCESVLLDPSFGVTDGNAFLGGNFGIHFGKILFVFPGEPCDFIGSPRPRGKIWNLVGFLAREVNSLSSCNGVDFGNVAFPDGLVLIPVTAVALTRH